METYSQFRQRIDSFEKPNLAIDFHKFIPSNSVLSKIKEDNSFASFFGDTVVFDLEQRYKERVFKNISLLYEEVPECFSQKLDLPTLHMTLHDLSNDSCLENVKERMEKNATNLFNVLSTKRKCYQQIRMRTNFIINMVNTSLVLALYPTDVIEYDKLMVWYNIVDEVQSLPYLFTPHITLAYYNRNGFKESSAIHLAAVVERLNKNFFELMLNTQKLQYQRFTSMNEYQTVFSLLD